MATLNTSNGQFAQTFTVNQQSGSYILLSTANKYVDKDIKITTNVKLATSAADTATANTDLFTTDGSNAGVNIGAVSGVVGAKATTEPTSGYYIAVTASASGNSKITDAGWIAAGSLTAATASQTQYYPIQSGAYSTSGGGLTANTGYANITTNAYYSGGAYDNTDLISVNSQTTDTEGYYKITVEGYGNVKRAAIKKTASKAGYIPANTSGTQTSAATNLNSKKAYANLYIKKSTLTSSSITPSTSDQTVTISEGYYPSDRTISIGAMATTTVTTSYDNTGMSTYFDSLSSSSGANVTITPKYSNSPAGYLAAHTTATNNGGVGYWKIITTTRSAGAGSVTLTAGNGTATFAVGNGDSASTDNTSLAFTSSPPSAGAYYTLTITGKGTVSGTGKGTVSTGTGWVTSGSTTSNASASSSKDSNTATIYRYIMKSVPGSAVSNALPSSISGRTAGTYEDIEIQPKGYIKIPAGYNPTDKYIFANIADASGESRAASGYSLSVSSISGSSDVIVGTTKTNNKYPVTANNISVTATLSASTAGWFSSGSATDGDTDSVSVGYINEAEFSTTAGVTTITSAGYLPANTVVTNLATVTPAFDGGALTSKGASATGTNATLETTNNSGISILAKGTAGRAAVLYNGAVNGYVNVADNTTASAAVASSTWNGTTYYLKNVTLPKDKTFAVTTSADTALDTTSDLDITNAAYRRVDVTNAANGTVLIANSGNSTVTSGSATAGNLSVNAYDNASTPALSGAKSIVSNGKWVTTSVSASGTYYGKVTVGTATLGSEGSVTTAPSVAVTNSTTMVTTATNTGYSFTVGGTATNGTVQTKYKATAAGYTPIVSATNGGTVTVTPGVTGGKTVYIQAAAGSVTMSKGNGSCVLQTSNNVTTSDTNTSGVSVTFRGSGAVSATAKITTAGYTPTNTSFATGSSTTSNTADLTKYITGVTLTKGKSFSITVPNGALNSDGTNNDTITFVFTVANDNTGNVTIAGPD